MVLRKIIALDVDAFYAPAARSRSFGPDYLGDP
jgi:nucleotidyltransferase/DNA polymerase involved in DNA repair